MQLRQYQTELINNTRNEFYNHNRVLVVSGCGSGKTIMFAYMAEQHLKLNKNGYIWFLVHRQELISQTIKTFTDNELSMNNVLIGMVQTVSLHLDRYKTPSMIIFDEAHHSTAKTWERIINTYPDVFTVGLTATPCRLDGKPLGNIYESMVEGPSVRWLIDNHYLSDFDYYAPQINLMESEWVIKGSDYDMQSVERAFDKSAIYGDIIKYLDLTRKTIIYCPSINYAKTLEKAIGSDISREFDGNTPDTTRKQIIQDFRDGKIRVLLNVDLIGEGFDVPDCDSCMLLRPTMSVALYIQQSMRCMRYRDNKRAVIYDFVGNCFRHGLPDDDRCWSLTKQIKTRNTSSEKELLVRQCKKCFRVYPGTNRICPYCENDNGKTRKQIEEENKAELVKITELKKKQERREVGMARTFESLVELGRKRGYKNPIAWARFIYNSRKEKEKCI